LHRFRMLTTWLEHQPSIDDSGSTSRTGFRVYDYAEARNGSG
jgi:hypothetical protein